MRTLILRQAGRRAAKAMRRVARGVMRRLLSPIRLGEGRRNAWA
jgi:hypothetical protein